MERETNNGVCLSFQMYIHVFRAVSVYISVRDNVQDVATTIGYSVLLLYIYEYIFVEAHADRDRLKALM